MRSKGWGSGDVEAWRGGKVEMERCAGGQGRWNDCQIERGRRGVQEEGRVRWNDCQMERRRGGVSKEV